MRIDACAFGAQRVSAMNRGGVTFRSKERFDRRKLRCIIANWNVVPIPAASRESWAVGNTQFVPETVLRRYLHAAEGDVVEVSYRRSGADDRARGRQHVVDALGLQTFPRPVRHTIARDIYHDEAKQLLKEAKAAKRG